MTMTAVSLFAGIGGIDLALERAGKACVSTSNGRPFTGWVHRERLSQAQQVPEHVPAATVEAWKTAVAAHQAKLRRQRTVRPAPEPHIYRKPTET